MGEKAQVKRAICHWCHSRCKVSVQLVGSRLVKVEEDKEEHRAERLRRVVRACPRARAAADWFYHPGRLNYPLKRTGERGESKWQSISWEQALDEIAKKLKEIKERHGAEAIATTSGTGRTHDEYRGRFLNLLGSPNNIGQGHICFGPTNIVSSAILGWSANHTGLRPGVTKCIMVWGSNPPQSDRGLWQVMLDTINAGAKLIVVDPRRTAIAERADIWLQDRPGTDTALAMGMINVIINEGLYDKEFVDKWCYGWDELVKRAQDYSPEKVAGITWVPAEKVKEAARMYATTKPATSAHMMGLEHIANSIEAIHARCVLPTITGNIDVRGGDPLTGPPPQYIGEHETELNNIFPTEQKEKQLGTDRFKLLSFPGYDLIQPNLIKAWGKGLPRIDNCFANAPTLYRAIITGKPYPVRAVITLSSNPMVTQPNAKVVYKALKSLDLYVVMDYFMTPSAELADYVLPAASWIERPVLYTIYDSINFIDAHEAALPPVVEGQRERRTDYDFWRGLGIRLGQEEYWPWHTLEEAYDYRLAPMGYTFKEFIAKKGGYDRPASVYKKYEQTGFATATGKVELYSTILEKLGYDPLPNYYEPPESPISTPDLAKEYPLILITGSRHQPFFHSEHRQVDSLRNQHPNPLIQINPETASELGISDGDWVWIETPRGRVRQKCQYFDGIDPRVVNAQHGWWFPELPGEEPWLHGVWESNINVVIDDDPEVCNKISGGWPMRGLLCKVYKAKAY